MGGWDGTGYRITQEDLAVLQRSNQHLRDLYEERMRFLQERNSERGIVHPRLCWDDMPPVMCERQRRLREGRAEIVSVIPNAQEDILPAVMSESLWSALEGGRAVITARVAQEMAELDNARHPAREDQLVLEMGPRRYGEIRRRSVKDGRLENSVFLGDQRPLVIRECTFAGCIFRQCEFGDVVFDQCSFTQCRFINCHFHDCVVIDCDWDETRWGDWWTNKITITGLSSRKDDAEEEEIERRRLNIDWHTVNRVENMRIEGSANSIRDARGIGPAAFMPDRLAKHFTGLAAETRRTWMRTFERHRGIVARGTTADGEPLILEDKRRMHAEREKQKENARWWAQAKDDTHNPMRALMRFRELPHINPEELTGFAYAV